MKQEAVEEEARGKGKNDNRNKFHGKVETLSYYRNSIWRRNYIERRKQMRAT